MYLRFACEPFSRDIARGWTPNILCHLVGPHGCFRSSKDLQAELLHVGIGGHRIRHSVIIGVLFLKLHTATCQLSWSVSSVSQERILRQTYAFQLVHKVRRV